MTAPSSSSSQQLSCLLEGDGEAGQERGVGEGRGCKEEQADGEEEEGCEDAFFSHVSDSEPKGETGCSGPEGGGRHQPDCSCTAVRVCAQRSAPSSVK